MTDVEVAGVDVCLVSSQWTEILIIDVKKLGEVAVGRNKNEGIKLVIDVDELDFVRNPEDLGNVINRIDAEIHGLF